MRWLNFTFNLLLNLFVGIISSLIATALYPHYRQPLTSAVKWFQVKIREYRRAIQKATQLALLGLSLRSRAVITSAECRKLILLSMVTIAFLPIMFNLVLFINGGMTSDQVKRSSDLSPWAYQVTRDQENLETTLHLLHNGAEVYSVDSTLVDLVFFQADGSSEVHPTYLQASTGDALNFYTKDITGDNLPDILLMRDCGCSAGLRTYTILSLDTEVREIFNLEDTQGEWEIADLDGDHMPEIITADFIEDVGEDSKSLVATAKIVLKYENGSLNLASGLMKKHPPTDSEFLNKIAQDKRSLNSAERSEPDASYIAQLVFSGNGELAYRYVNLVMSEKSEGEREFYWSSIYGKMMGSSYWDEVAALNQWPPDKYAFKDCPY